MLVCGLCKSLQRDGSNFTVLSMLKKHFNFINLPLFFGGHKIMANKATFLENFSTKVNKNVAIVNGFALLNT
jgi:hypothetical protein